MSSGTRTRLERAGAMAVVAALTACRTPDPAPLTELVVLVDSDLGAADPLASVDLRVVGPAGFEFARSIDLAASDAPRLPLTLGFVHRRGAREGFRFSATAHTVDGASFTQTVETDFVRAESRLVDLALLDACVAADCGSDRVCTGRDRCSVPRREPSTLRSSETVTHLAAGQSLICARVSTGRVRCWGRSANVEGVTDPLPLGTSTPTEVANLTDATDLDVGDFHACALRASGAVACWGLARMSALGVPGDGVRSDAVDVPGVTGAVQLALGRSHSCARFADGAVRCWGSNAVGQLGNGGGPESVEPVAVALPEPAREIASGTLFTCARSDAGRAFCWGFNSRGELGDGSMATRQSPVAVAGLDQLVEIAAGADHACARRRDGTVWCWGANEGGELGDGTFVTRASPVQVTDASGGALTGAVQLALANGASCARLRGGRVLCWGADGSQQLGDGRTQDRNRAGPVLENGRGGSYQDALSLVGAGYFFCAINRERRVLCWGINQLNQLGTDATGPLVPYPRAVVGLP